MSEASRRSRVTITLGRSGQVVNRAGLELDSRGGSYELPRAGTKRSAKERLGSQSDSSHYGSEVISKRQRGETSFSGNDLQISRNDLRYKLMQKNAQRQPQSDECSTIDLREKLSRSEQPPRSLDTRPRMAEPRDVRSLGQLPQSRTSHGFSQMRSSSSSYSPWTLDDIRQRSPERFVGTLRGLSPPRNSGSIIGASRALSPPRNTRNFSVGSRGLSPARSAGGHMSSRGLSPTRNAGSHMSSRGLSPTRNAGSHMSSSRALSPARNPGSYMGSSRGSPPPRSIEDLHGRSRMLDDVRASPYTARSVLSSQVPASGAPYTRTMFPPPTPIPHPLPPLGQLPPLGSILQNGPFLGEGRQTVDSFLNSLGLGKYALTFKHEEVDMSAIKQMKESDLKDLSIPMGPRKKILQAIAALPKR